MHSNRKWPVITGIISVLIIVGIGIFFYHNFFRQTHGQLIETVPPNASFILQINDNEAFVKTSNQTLPDLNELLFMEALPGFESFMDKFPAGTNNEVIISCHRDDDRNVLLFSTKIKEGMFKQLLKTLRIDERNYIPFENAKIYSYGTHYKKFSFTFYNNFFSVAEDVELLKKSIVQLKHPRNLLSNKSFSSLYKNVILKNEKQNWLVLNHKAYFEGILNLFLEPYQELVTHLGEVSEWSAYQIRFKDKEIHLAGYALNNSPFFQKFQGQPSSAGIPTQIIPANATFYTAIRTPNPPLFVEKISPITKDSHAEAVTHFNDLAPIASFLFYLNQDTLNYCYLALQLDSVKQTINTVLPDSLTPENSITYKQSTIYKTKSGNFNALLSALHKEVKMDYVMEYQGYYIFSDSITSLQYYLNRISEGNLNNQPLYRFAKSNIPTLNNYEFCMLIPDNKILQRFSAQKKKSTHLVNGLQIFTYTFAAPDKDFVPINVYLKMK